MPRPGAHVARAALAMLASENEAGHICPISMTYAAVPVLRQNGAIAEEWNPRVFSTVYDPEFRPAPEKRGALIGMAMTEKQGGSDVRANVTRAEPASDGGYALNGHKWFCSAPMSDAFLVLAQAPARAFVFSAAALDAGWQAQCVSFAAAEAQTGEPVERLERGGISRGVGAADWRRGPRRGHHHGDGAPYATGLRDRVGGLDAACSDGSRCTMHGTATRSDGP